MEEKGTLAVTAAMKKSLSQTTLLLSKHPSTESTDATSSETKELHLEATMAGVELILCDHHDDLLSADIRGKFEPVFMLIRLLVGRLDSMRTMSYSPLGST